MAIAMVCINTVKHRKYTNVFIFIKWPRVGLYLEWPSSESAVNWGLKPRILESLAKLSNILVKTN